MKNTKISFYNKEYEVSVGDKFQVEVSKGLVNQIFVVQCNDNETVYLEILNRISNSSCLVRVNEIQWKENDKIHTENYKDKSTIEMIEGFTKKQLVQYAQENNFDINTKLKKSELVSEIKDLLYHKRYI